MTVVRVYACAFSSALSFEHLIAKLREVSDYEWIDRDNDSWGGYISARVLPDPHWGMLKLLRDEDDYILNVVLKSGTTEAEALPLCDAVEENLFDDLLPALGATNLRKVESYE